MTKRQLGLLAAGLALGLLVFGGSLGRRHLYHSDEARFALLAQDILVRGDWLVPRLRDEPYMNKPPLFIWLIALLSLPGHRVTEFTAQVPAALAAAGAVIGTALIGARLWGARVGGVAALILATSVGYVHHAGLVLTDMLLTCFVVFALDAFYTGIRHDDRRALAMAYGLVGLAVLSKGPAGFLAVLPAAAAAIDRQGWRGWRALASARGLALLAALLLPFALVYLTRDAGHYVTSVWRGDYLTWITSPGDQPASPLHPVLTLAAGILPWAVLIPLALREVASRWRADEGTRWVVWWLGLLLLVFLLLPPKRTRYLLPLYPPVALLIAQAVERLHRARVPAAWCRLTAVLWLALSGAAMAFLLGAGRAHAGAELLAFPPAVGVEVVATVSVLVAGAVVGGAFLAQGRMRPAVLTLAASTAALLVIVEAGYPIRYNAVHDMPGLAGRARAALGPGDQIVTYQYGKLSLDFYLGRPVPELGDLTELRRLMAGPDRVLCVLEERRLAAADASAWMVLDRVVVGGRPIVLVANRPARAVPGTRVVQGG